MMKLIRIAKLFSVSLLEILTVEVCFSSVSQNGDYYDCNVIGGESRYIVSKNQMSWHLANEFCQNKSSSLLVIQNGSQQNALETYLNNCVKSFEPRIDSVWTLGKRETYANWTWINGQTVNLERRIASDPDASKTHAMLRTQSITAENPLVDAWYLCQCKDHPCNGENQVNLTNGCLIPSDHGNTSWYEARNECLSNNGDLAVLANQDLQKLNNNILKKPNYWIGLRKVNWNWKTNMKKQEVKYTKWANGLQPTSGEICISINTANGLWTASDCNNAMPVVCEKHGQIPISPTMNSITTKPNAIKTTTPRKDSTATSTNATSTTTSSTKYNNVSTNSLQGHIPTSTTMNSITAQSTTTKNMTAAVSTNGMTETTEATKLPSALIIGITSVGVVIIIVCIIVIVIVLCRTSRSSTSKTEPKADEVKLQKTKEQKPKETGEVLKTDETRCIYADIPPAEKIVSDQPGGGQPGIVYASLEFDQGVTYAEPMKRKSQNPVDSVGPIYAEPFKAMRSQNGTTSSSSPSNQATKIGPMGDVYTLPSPNISSPSANMTQSPIYANTQT